MVQNEIQERIDELKRQIDSLPSGTDKRVYSETSFEWKAYRLDYCADS